MATMPNTNINIPYSAFLDPTTGRPSQAWLLWLMSPSFISVNLGSALPVTSGGTGLTTIPTNGQLLIGNGVGYTLNTLGYGAGISVTNGSGTITVANTGVLSNLAGSGISVSSATGNVTIGNTGVLSIIAGSGISASSSTGNVTLANTGVLSWSGGTTGLTPATATTGAVTLAGTLAIASGGTNGTATPTAYGVAYGTGTAYAFTAAGTAKQVLIANTSAAPTWSTLTSGTSILYGDGSGGFSNVTIGSGVSFVAGTLSATGSGGTVTSVTGTSPVVSSGGNTPAISLATAYGDTLNPYASKTANTILAAPSGSAGVPTFRALTTADLPALPYGTGTVTSVGLSLPSIIAVTNSPVTTSGTLTGTLTTQAVNSIFAGPSSGAAAAPTFRALTTTDIPSLSYVSSVGATAPITSTGGLTPTIGVTSAVLAKTDDTNVTMTLSGAPTTALLAATTMTLGWSGQLAVSRGGTGLSTGTSGGMPYFSSTSAMASSALLTQYGVVYGGGAGAAPVATAAGTTGQVLTATTSGAPTWASPATNGTVTSVSFTGGIVSVATATTTPALTVAGTSGGIPYFSSGTTWASSAALAANALVIGGGAGVAPSTTTTGTGVVTALGVNTGTAGAFVVNAGALGTPSSGTVTNLTGTASININGTVGATTTNTGSFTSLTYSTTLTGGTGIVNLGSGQFYKDASGNIGVGTTSPSYPVVVSRADTTSTIGGSSASMHILNTDSTVYGRLSELIFNLVNQASGSALAAISGQYATYGGSYGGNLLFSTNPGSGGSVAERLRITSDGLVGVGTTTPSASALLDVQSTTKGVRMPNMTTTQKNAISSPAAGLMVFDTTLAKLCVYSGAAWQTITSI